MCGNAGIAVTIGSIVMIPPPSRRLPGSGRQAKPVRCATRTAYKRHACLHRAAAGKFVDLSL